MDTKDKRESIPKFRRFRPFSALAGLATSGAGVITTLNQAGDAGSQPAIRQNAILRYSAAGLSRSRL
jgi:hypothetical protein